MKLVTKITKHSQQLQRWVLILLIIIVFSQAYVRSERNTRQSQPYIVNYVQALSIAISELVYGSEQGIGYMKVHNTFGPLLWGNVDWGPEFSMVNNAIERAVQLEDVASDGRHSTIYEGGLATYYKLAFLIFGYKAESAFYLYWLFLAVSVVIFIVTFYKRPVLLFYLLLFAIALFAISQTQGVLIESLIRNRFLPILGVLPSFYLVLIISGEHKRNWLSFVGVMGQGLIMAFIVYVRPSAIYQLMFLVAATLILVVVYKQPFARLLVKSLNWFIDKPLAVLWRTKMKDIRINTIPTKTLQLWPVVIVLVSYILIRLFTLNPVFENTVTNRGCSWHMFYMGLSGHPQAHSKYGIILSDGMVAELVRSRAPEWGYDDVAVMSFVIDQPTENSENVIPLCTSVYEEIVKDEFLKIVMQDPWFVVSSYFYKIRLYFQVYFNTLNYNIVEGIYDNPLRPTTPLDYYNFGVVNNLIDWPVIIALILGLFLVEGAFLREWLSPLFLLSLGFLWALSIPIVYYPINNTIVDSALYLTMVLLFLFSAGVYYSIRFIQKRVPIQNSMLKLSTITFVVLLPAFILPIALSYQPRIQLNWLQEGKLVRPETSFYGQVADEIIGIYNGIGVFLYQDKFYAVPQLMWPLDENSLNNCLQRGECAVADSQAEVLRLANQLSLSSNNDLTHLIKTITTSSSYPEFGPELLLNQTSGSIYAWHSRRLPEFPQWIDIVFHQPITLENIGLQAQVYNPFRAPRNIVVLLSDENSELSEIATLTFDFDGDGAWSFRRIPDSVKKSRHYRLLILDNYGDREFVTIQEIRFHGQIELEEYKGFGIVWMDGAYRALAQSPWLNHTYEGTLTQCRTPQQCLVGDSLENIKQQIDQLPPVENKLASLVKKVTSSSSHPTFSSPGFLFDNVADPANAWHSDQVPEFPRWIDIEFQEPVTLSWIGLQAQMGGENQHRAPHNVVVLGGEDPETAEYKADLRFELDQAGAWSFQELPESKEKFQRYRIMIMDNHQGQADFVTIQEIWLGILIEKDYKGFNILWGNGEFYILDQSIELLASTQLTEFSPGSFQAFCAQNGRCGLADSLEEAKQLIHQLAASVP